jgi:uncharacterized protein (TIRG00374 family)
MASPLRTYLINLGKLTIGVVIIMFLVRFIGSNDIKDNFESASVKYIVYCVLLFLCYYITACTNIWLLLRAQQPFPFLGFFKGYTETFTFSLLSIGQFGDASLPVFLARYNVPAKVSASAYFIDKFIAVVVMLSAAAAGALVLLSLKSVMAILLTLVAFVALVPVSIFVIAKMHFKNKYLLAVQVFILNTSDNIKGFSGNRGAIVLNFVICLAKWQLLGFSYYCAFRAFGVTTGWQTYSLIPILSSLAGYLPISLSGIGVVESYAVFLFSKAGVPKAVILNGYVLQRLINYSFAAICYVLLDFVIETLFPRIMGAREKKG